MFMTIAIKTEAARLLAEVGFLGLSRGLQTNAEVVFTCLRGLRPDDEAGHIGLALSRLSDNDAAGALETLKAARQTEAVMAFCCLAHMRVGDKAAAQELREELAAMGAAKDLQEIATAAVSNE